MPRRLTTIIEALKNDADRLRLFLMVTVGYSVFNVANHYLTESLYLETGAHLIHVPSGIRMVIVLVAGVLGAVAMSSIRSASNLASTALSILSTL